MQKKWTVVLISLVYVATRWQYITVAAQSSLLKMLPFILNLHAKIF